MRMGSATLHISEAVLDVVLNLGSVLHESYLLVFKLFLYE